ncbi:DinB family protein [Fulvivirgaceae bacterium BMA10]|uniref:DinB family protein n=1 Tax=Splendidivirga corallicola TaxID=3051826 RepID=A0ABT8KRL4_9BACT|nr:DinB family protein [Fulvivirgaceae bacterium BMA10]
MANEMKLEEAILASWRTNNQVNVYLFENLPGELWPLKVPGAPRRTVQMIAGHIHNCRCMWIKMLNKEFNIKVPGSVNRHKVTKEELIPALMQSSEGIIKLIELNLTSKVKKIPNFHAGNVVDFVAYFIAHEAHHRGQICMLARQLGHRLPKKVAVGIWEWTKRRKEWSR